MTSSEVEHIMQIMFHAVNNGEPYHEDYYYQAFVNRHCKGRNDAFFEPQSLRDYSCGVSRIDPSVNVKFAPVEGLGKIVYNNIRAPRVLLDFSAPTNPNSDPNEMGGEGQQKSLDQVSNVWERVGPDLIIDSFSLLSS